MTVTGWGVDLKHTLQETNISHRKGKGKSWDSSLEDLFLQNNHLSPEKKTRTFHYTGCLTGILVMAHYNPHVTVQYNRLYTLNNLLFFHAHLDSTVFLLSLSSTPPISDVENSLKKRSRAPKLQCCFSVFECKKSHTPMHVPGKNH